jgi:hypothetical protein
MATDLDTKLIPKVLALVNNYGTTATFVELTTQTYDPTDGDVTEVGVNHNHKVTPPQPVHQFREGDVVRIGDCEINLPASGLGFTPDEGMRVVIGSETWRIVRFDPIYTGDLVALYRIFLRRT